MRKRLQGTVVSDKMDKTISVAIDRIVAHPRYGKHIRRKSILKADDPRKEAREGDLVEIEETRPLSKTKSCRLVRILRRAEPAVALKTEDLGVGPVTGETPVE